MLAATSNASGLRAVLLVDDLVLADEPLLARPGQALPHLGWDAIGPLAAPQWFTWVAMMPNWTLASGVVSPVSDGS